MSAQRTASGRPMSRLLVFFGYICAAFLALLAWRAFTPAPAAMIPIFLWKWRALSAFVNFIQFFPAIILSACFLASMDPSDGAGSGQRFTRQFMDAMSKPVIMAIVCSLLYAGLLMVALPLSSSAAAGMESRSLLYRDALIALEQTMAKGEWEQASRYMAMCERIWPFSPGLEQQRGKLLVELRGVETQRRNAARSAEGAMPPSLPGETYPLGVLEALAKSRQAMENRRFYDAHWFASVAERLAKSDSPESRESRNLLTGAMREIEGQVPEAELDTAAYQVYRQKREGYRAIQAGDWVSAYYLFMDLKSRGHADDDVRKYLAMSTQGLTQLYFFSDELGRVVGQVQSRALFSLPRQDGGRDVLAARSAFLFSDATYFEDLQLIRLAADGSMLFSVRTPMAKLLPFLAESGTAEVDGERSAPSVLLLVSRDRTDKSLVRRPVWTGTAGTDGIDTRLFLELEYDELFLLSKSRQGAKTLNLFELMKIGTRMESYGFVREAFLAELLARLSEPFLFLALAIWALAFGWRMRPLGPRAWWFILVIALLPVVAQYIVQFVRMLVATLAGVLVLALPLPAAVIALFVSVVAILFGAIVYLAGQRS